MRNILNDAFQLMISLKDCVSPFHTVKASIEKLEANGFRRVDMNKNWAVEKGGRYYANVYDTTLFAFTVGENFDIKNGMRLACAHTDWPCLRIKPNPEVIKNGYASLNVEVYGGPILNTWLDRPLSIAGRVTVKGKDSFLPDNRLVDFKRSILTVPNLAVHLNREVNKGVELNKQTELLPLFAMAGEELDKDNYFINALALEAKVKPEDILYYDLYIYNCDAGQLLGLNSDFISSPRLDNVTGVEACINGIIESENKDTLNIAVLFDNEEIGSRTKQGAGSQITNIVIEKIMTSLGIERKDYLCSLFNSTVLSVDVAHALHPNYSQKYDITSTAALNNGLVIKTNTNQSYATDGTSIGIIKSICEENDIPYQMFANRSDVVGGSTLGSISSAFTAMQTVDVGVPILAMHSAREVMGARDMSAMNELVEKFYNI